MLGSQVGARSPCPMRALLINEQLSFEMTPGTLDIAVEGWDTTRVDGTDEHEQQVELASIEMSLTHRRRICHEHREVGCTSS